MFFLSLQKFLCIFQHSVQTYLSPAPTGPLFSLWRVKWHHSCHRWVCWDLLLPAFGLNSWMDMLQSQGNCITSVEGGKQWLLLKTKKWLYTCHCLYEIYSQHSLQTPHCPQHSCMSPTLDHNLIPNDQFITLMFHAQVDQRSLQHQGGRDNRKKENWLSFQMFLLDREHHENCKKFRVMCGSTGKGKGGQPERWVRSSEERGRLKKSRGAAVAIRDVVNEDRQAKLTQQHCLLPLRIPWVFTTNFFRIS